jgi:hypothetical protein
MKRLVTALLAGGAIALVTTAIALGAARTEAYKVSSTLTAKAEVPAPKGAANAGGTFSGGYVEKANGSAVLTWKLTYSKLTGAATAAHIHMGKPGVAGAVIVPLCGPCTSGKVGKATISKSVVETLEKGQAYVNVHTAKNAGGEIRGQVKVTG